MIAKFLALSRVADWLIARAKRTPDEHLPGYMERYWLFNPYNRETRQARYPWIPFSIRIHHILRADDARHPHDHPHDHPWNARTFLLKRWYVEDRAGKRLVRFAGESATLKYGEYHHIAQVAHGGVWTMFVMGRYRGTWGFLVGGRKVPFREYLGD